MPCALITGVAGQDGSYLAEWLVAKGYQVHGLLRPGSLSRAEWLRRNCEEFAGPGRLMLHELDVVDAAAARSLFCDVTPDEVYHLAGESHVGRSFEHVAQICESVGMATVRLLEACCSLTRVPRFFHASSSEVFGRPAVVPQNEQTPFRPVTPYGCAKAFATQMVSLHRQSFGVFACNCILYNHESPRRGPDFVTQKICLGAAAIKRGIQKELVLGDLNARRDWGDAREFVRAMWLMLQQPKPEDYVLATGQTHAVRDIAEIAFSTVGLDWREHVRQDQLFLRPTDPDRLVGDATKAREELRWQPTRAFKELIVEMTLAASERLS